MNIEGHSRDGEVDFVIAHPKQGVPMIEVKGGAAASWWLS
jgi:hypothetical protein